MDKDVKDALSDIQGILATPTQLHGAVMKNELETVKQLLKAGVDPNQKDGDGDVPLGSRPEPVRAGRVLLPRRQLRDDQHPEWRARA